MTRHAQSISAVNPGVVCSAPGFAMQEDTTRPDLDALYRQYAPLVFRRARRFFDESQAEEVVHEVFMKLMDHYDGFRGDSSPVTWLYRVTTNHCLNKIRDQKRRNELLAEQAPVVRSLQHKPVEPDVRLFLDQVMRQLDDELRQIGIYHFVDGMTNREVARVMGCSPRTIVTRLQTLKEMVLVARGDKT